VIGGGLAGMLAAVAVSGLADEVVILERDVFPAEPGPRRGLPQGPQNHMLMAGGAQAIDSLLPRTIARLRDAGAHKLSMGGDIMTQAAGRWLRTAPDGAYVITCSRHLLDHIVRGQVLGRPGIRVEQSATVVGLAGSAQRVTGVVVEDAAGSRTVTADFVIDAAGSRSKSVQWLGALGLPAVVEEQVDAGLAYASRVYEAPAKASDDFPGILVQPRANASGIGQGGAFMPQEDGRWIVSLIGTAGGHAPTSEDGFLEFARSLPVPFVAELMEMARPVTSIRGAHGLANRRRRFDRAQMPGSFLVLGDSAMVISPNYATGMSIAALGALALRTHVKRYGLAPDAGRALQRELVKVGQVPWKSATALDSLFTGAKANFKIRGAAMQQRMTARYSAVAAENPAVLRAIYEVASLTGPQSRLMSPSVLAVVLRGPRLPALTLAAASAQFPQFSGILDSRDALPQA
jgi:2-polyprenyl-6-methoxyphenol hydroxylase-like FAD-dependent oxidoreductase